MADDTLMHDLALILDTFLNPAEGKKRTTGFALLVFPLEGGEHHYIATATADRKLIVTMLKEQIASFEKKA